ncbi:MAG: DUF362 domain-containing protein [Candidatus Woesearchaeota archaeon]
MKRNSKRERENEISENVLVGVFKCDSYDSEKIYNIIKKGLKEINFDFSKYKKKKKPLCILKPNIIIPISPESAVVTHPTIVEALIRILLENGFKVIVAESDGSATTYEGFVKSGIKKVADKYNVECVAFEDSKRNKLLKVRNENNILLKEFYVSDLVKKADLIINLPKLKTHVLTTFTGSVKNMFGIIPGATKAKYHGIAKTPEEFSNLLLDVYYSAKPELNIMDGIVGMEGNGPSRGNPKKAGLILISENGVALDIIATRIIGLEHKVILNKIALKREKNLENKIKIVGDFERLPLIKFEAPMQFNRKIFSFIQSNAIRAPKKPFIEKKKCIKCLRCYSNCPARAIILVNNYPHINPKKCITCYCCYEQCPANAVKLKKSFITIIYEALKSFFTKIRRIISKRG